MKIVIKRPEYLVFRYGGEEFALILPNTTEKEALEIAESVRQQIKLLNIAHDTSTVSNHVTLSLGVACTIPDSSHPASIIVDADRALYKAKSLGRDRVVYARVELSLS